MPNTAPYGTWISPIAALDLAAGSHPVDGGRFVDSEIWWSELRPAEGGRYLVRRRAADGEVTDLLPPPWNARTRVHEYGGGAWTVTPAQTLVFAEFSDQRLYKLEPGSTTPVPISPVPAVEAGLRYAQLSVLGSEVLAIRETHTADGQVSRDICAVPLDGSGAAESAAAIRSVVSGSHFLAHPRVSPDGKRLAWIAWEHPQMPWDGTELRVADLGPDGVCGPARTLIGGLTESVLQPEWADAETLTVISDRSGWWNLYRFAVGASPEELAAITPIRRFSEDLGGPLWQLGSKWYAPTGDGRLLTVRTLGSDQVGLLDPITGALTDLDLGPLATVRLCDVRGSEALVLSGGARVATGLRRIDLTTGAFSDVRLSVDELPDPAYLPEGKAMTFPGRGGREVHALVYPPSNQDFLAPVGELPPYVAFVHGGPTSHVSPSVDLVKAFFTSRGIGVVDVNYGGSTGYGREYRERLRGQWGIVDVEDTVAAVIGLANSGLADPARLAIEGGSAGGWTVLASLTSTDAFACGASYFGVAELIKFAQDTHDFESRYLDGLIGKLPEDRELYVQRAPLSHVDDLSCPVLLLQGLDDPIVPPSQAEMFRDALVRKGIPHAYIAYAGESHGFRRAETIVNARESELSFYGQVMGFEPPGVPKLPLWTPES
ncbi:MAG: putative secreted prolyl oligopeptidase [Frankiales bacterium]|nr:putative secreted prolyl oligopeptidase [Frankiales bacterium]